MKSIAIPPLLMTGLCLFVGQYLLTLFFRFRKTLPDKAYLSFALAAFAAALFNLASAFFYDADAFVQAAPWERIRYATLALFIPTILFFVFDLTGRRKRIILPITMAFLAVAAIYKFTDLGISPARITPTRLAWFPDSYYESEPTYLTGILFVLVLLAMGWCFFLILREKQSGANLPSILLVMISLHVLTIINDLLVYFQFYSSIYLSEYGFLFLILGLGAALQGRFVNMHLRVVASEEKYRRLVEDSRDIIFSLDLRGRFISINNVVRTVLDYSPDMLLGTRLTDLPHAEDEHSLLLKQNLIQEEIQALLDTGESVEFEMDIATRGKEPVELKFRLELTGQSMILGKAYHPADDVLVKYRDTDKQTYTLGNNFAAAEMLNRHLAAGLRRFLSPDEIVGVRTGIREMLTNAIEHGNLGISFEEKTRAMEDGTLAELIRGRQADERYRERVVAVEYDLNPREVSISITDQGPGFDHDNMLKRDIKSKSAMRLMHGRGIAITKVFFDELRYNEAGNRVFLRKILGGKGASEKHDVQNP